MKPLHWPAALVVVLSQATYAQVVDFNNNRSFTTEADRYVRFADGTLVVGTNYAVQLYYGADVSSLQTPSTVPARFRITSTASPGTWSGGNRTLTGFSVGDTVTMLLRAWDVTSGPSYDAARAAGGAIGESAPFLYTIPPAGSPNTAFYMENFRGFRILQCTGVIRIAQPTNGSTFRGPASVTLQAELIGSGNVTNLIYVLGTNVLGSATTAPFTVTTASLPVNDYLIQAIARLDTGEYCASPQILVRVMQPPSPVVEPATYTALHGSTVTFIASPGGSGPNAYQWYGDNGVIPNATSSTLVLTNAADAMEGLYACVVSNAVGIATSGLASLRVRPVIVYVNGQPVHTPGYTSAAPVSVSFETAYERGTIFYTLDGAEPNFGSLHYVEPFTIRRTSFVRAKGYSGDFSESGEAEWLYIIRLLPPPLRTLTALAEGGGTIAVSPSKSAYVDGEVVQVTAQPEPGWSFLEWRGDVFGTNPAAALQMNADRCVHAIFATTLTTTVGGNGQVILDPPGGVYPWGTEVRLHAVPGASNYFVLWGNHASGSENPLAWPVRYGNPAISAAFFSLASNQVTLTTLVDGLGSVEVSPATNRYTRGQAVSVRALPGPQQTFVGWAGDASGAETLKVLVLNESQDITAQFTKIPTLLFGQPCRANFLNENGYYATLFGAWGAGYVIEYADTLGVWLPLVTITNTYGNTRFVDATATNAAQRFYRAALPQP